MRPLRAAGVPGKAAELRNLTGRASVPWECDSCLPAPPRQRNPDRGLPAVHEAPLPVLAGLATNAETMQSTRRSYRRALRPAGSAPAGRVLPRQDSLRPPSGTERTSTARRQPHKGGGPACAVRAMVRIKGCPRPAARPTRRSAGCPIMASPEAWRHIRPRGEGASRRCRRANRRGGATCRRPSRHPRPRSTC